MAHEIYFFLLFNILNPILAEPKFETQLIDDNVAIGYGLAIGDVDGDGKPDILLADKKQFVWYRNGDWKRFVMIENLTGYDNVCIAARDINGDGKVEVAVGAQWNPGETSDTLKSGSVHYLVRPEDFTQKWSAIELHHEPTIHRMRWVKVAEDRYHLVVVPLHGRGNKDGAGLGVKVFAYEMPKDPNKQWKYFLVDQSMHMTHNFDVISDATSESLYIGGKEGIKRFIFDSAKWKVAENKSKGWIVEQHSFGEVRVGKSNNQNRFVSGIEPMHGNELTVYQDSEPRRVLMSDLNQGHALATSDLLGLGSDQIVVGWREPDKQKKVGIKMFSIDAETKAWKSYWVDDNGIACEDLQIADLNADGKKDIIAAGRATHNLKVYWNKSGNQ